MIFVPQEIYELTAKLNALDKTASTDSGATEKEDILVSGDDTESQSSDVDSDSSEAEDHSSSSDEIELHASNVESADNIADIWRYIACFWRRVSQSVR